MIEDILNIQLNEMNDFFDSIHDFDDKWKRIMILDSNSIESTIIYA